MTKKHEKLVEEVCLDATESEIWQTVSEGEIWQIVSRGMGIMVEGGTDGVSRSLYRKRDRIVADIIAWLPRILSAARDGRLGLEEGAIETRIEMSDESSLRFLSAWIKELARDGYRRFIALSGTSQRDPVGGKEEE